MKCINCIYKNIIYKNEKDVKYECCLDHKDITKVIHEDNECLFYKDRIYHK